MMPVRLNHGVGTGACIGGSVPAHAIIHSGFPLFIGPMDQAPGILKAIQNRRHARHAHAVELIPAFRSAHDGSSPLDSRRVVHTLVDTVKWSGAVLDRQWPPHRASSYYCPCLLWCHGKERTLDDGVLLK